MTKARHCKSGKSFRFSRTRFIRFSQMWFLQFSRKSYSVSTAIANAVLAVPAGNIDAALTGEGSPILAEQSAAEWRTTFTTAAARFQLRVFLKVDVNSLHLSRLFAISLRFVVPIGSLTRCFWRLETGPSPPRQEESAG
jgi:hypothetical protein